MSSAPRTFTTSSVVLCTLAASLSTYALTKHLTSRSHRRRSATKALEVDIANKTRDAGQEATGRPKGRLMENTKIDEGATTTF